MVSSYIYQNEHHIDHYGTLGGCVSEISHYMAIAIDQLTV